MDDEKNQNLESEEIENKEGDDKFASESDSRCNKIKNCEGGSAVNAEHNIGLLCAEFLEHKVYEQGAYRCAYTHWQEKSKLQVF